MKIYQKLLCVALLSTIACAMRNTTAFWSQQLNTTLMFDSYSGYQEIEWAHPKGQSGMFYQLFGAYGCGIFNESSGTIPLIMWLQGGPGDSSQRGAFSGIGPIRIESGQPKLAPYSWNIMAHLLFVDSPLNTGYSYYGSREGKEQVSSTREAAHHLLNFLYNFYLEFPQLRSCPLILAGESYAGHYLPALASKITQNMTFQYATKVKLAGISIGGGWVDPINQIDFYDSHLWSVGCIDTKEKDTLKWYQACALTHIFDEDYEAATGYFDFINNNITTADEYFGGISMRNFRSYDQPDYSFADFLEKNKFNLGVTVKFLPNNTQVRSALAADVSCSFVDDLTLALQNTRVLVYNGQNDVTVNTAGVLEYLNNLQWRGIAQWKDTRKQIWTSFGEVRGWAKVAGNLWFVLVNGAGNEVMTERPLAGFSLLGHFLNNETNWVE